MNPAVSHRIVGGKRALRRVGFAGAFLGMVLVSAAVAAWLTRVPDAPEGRADSAAPVRVPGSPLTAAPNLLGLVARVGRPPSPPDIAAAKRPAPQGWEFPHYDYDGRFTFIRVRFSVNSRRGFGRGGPPWSHDYPRGEVNFLKILTEITNLSAVMEGSNILAFDDPELTRYPIAYVCEVGFWVPSPSEALGLREYLQKGGFLIVDDFRSDWELYNFQEQMRRVLPGYRLHQLDVSHEIFHSFFDIPNLDLAPPTYRGLTPAYFGIFEDDDPSKRLMVMINYNNDIGEYWEFSDVGYYPIDLSNEAYKLSVNYVVYAYTH